MLCQWESITGNLVLTTELKHWLATLKNKKTDEGLMLETSAFLLFTVANLRFNSVVNTKLPAEE